MLYDPKRWEPPATPDLRKPSLAGLAYLLRHRELWPQGFEWKYVSYDRCAIGLAKQYWRLPDHFSSARSAAELFGIPIAVSMNLFTGGAWSFFAMVFGRIKPEMVAAEIDKYMESIIHA